MFRLVRPRCSVFPRRSSWQKFASLRRAFLAADAESVTVSLWQVSDHLTSLRRIAGFPAKSLKTSNTSTLAKTYQYQSGLDE